MTKNELKLQAYELFIEREKVREQRQSLENRDNELSMQIARLHREIEEMKEKKEEK